MSGLRPELHVAQQIRRDKLRIQNSSQHLEDFPNNITEQVSLHQGPGFSSDLLHVRNVRNGNNMLDDDDDKAALYSSEMMISNFSTPSNPLPTASRNTLECQELGEPSNSSRLMMPHYGSLFPQYSSASTIHSSPKEQCQPRTNNLGTWRNNTTAPHHQFSDWMLNYPTTTSVAANQTNPNSFLASELLINNNHYNNNNVKPSCNLLTDLQSSSPSSTSGGEMATREIQKQLGEMHNTMHYPSSSSAPLYHNALLQDIFKTTSSTGAHVSEMASLMHHGIWGGNNSVPVFHGNQANVCNTPHHQGLSLSLSSNSQSEPSSASHFEERSVNVKPSIVSRDCGKQLHQDSTAIATTPPSNAGYRNVGPLGPFTGYATILKSSRFLKPCQQLLDECCCCQKAPAEWVSRDHHVSGSTSAHDGAVINVDELSGVSAKGGASSSMLYASKENSSSADGGAATSFCLSSRPECQKNKAKLLYMQEEVTRRHKQYHQQMQMVVSSFESVAGLSSATPYISLALKSVSRHFRCLKNSISDQLKLTYEVLGEDFPIPSTSTSCKIDNNIARLRSMDHSFQKNKSGGSNIDFLEPQLQQVWRPQRGLPERSVAILKAWLFEHFLHPYPTDTDKHMLATQTGLSRNQVSNWFINARVRVWKPMVEEIHMLETKGTTETHQNNSKNEGASPSECSKHARSVDQHVNMFSTHGIAERQFQCLEMGSTSGGNEEKGTNHEEQWNQEKRSKLECEITPNMDGTTVMGFMPYRRGSGLEVGGIGSVSLTLGLRHGVEGVQQHQQQQLQHQEELRRHYGGHMIHDFVG